MSGEQRPLVQNAADPEQVREAGKIVKKTRASELADLKYILKIPQVRSFLWRLLKHCSVFSSIWRPSAEIHHLSGKQDVGHFIMSEITQADEESYFEMMRENQKENSNG